MREIKLRKVAGELVQVDRVRADWFQVGRTIRDALLNLPSRLSGVFAAENNQEKIFKSFSEEINLVLTTLANGEFHKPATVGVPIEESQRPEPSPNETRTFDESEHDGQAHTDLDREAEHREDRFSTGD